MDARPLSPDEKLARRANLRSPNTGGIAQLVERLVRNEKARGSNPLTSKAAGVEVKSTSGLIIGSLGGA